MDEEPNENNDGIVEGEAPADAPPAAGAEATAAPAASAPTPLTSEKVLDIALGVAVIAGEALDKAAQRFSERAKELQEQAPGFWDTAEERGRPVREKLVSSLKGNGPVPAEGGASSGTTGTGGLADSLRNLGSNIGITVGGGNARQSAEEEIRGLEDRVRELEQVVVSGKTGMEPEPEMPVVEAEAPTPFVTPELPAEPVSEATTAESASYAFGTDQHEDTLEASPYAVSETEAEQALEGGASPMDAELVVDVPSPELPTSASPRASRRKQRDFEPEVADENAPTPTPTPEA